MPQVRLVEEPKGCISNYWLQAIVLDPTSSDQRDAILTATNDAGLMTRPAWGLMHKLRPYLACPKMDLPMAEALEQRVINLPSSACLGLETRP
jgi:perosamine synthetase